MTKYYLVVFHYILNTILSIRVPIVVNRQAMNGDRNIMRALKKMGVLVSFTSLISMIKQSTLRNILALSPIAATPVRNALMEAGKLRLNPNALVTI